MGEWEASVVTGFNVKLLDEIVRDGEALSAAVDSLPREYLRALADRVDLQDGMRTDLLQTAVKRRLVKANGSLRG